MTVLITLARMLGIVMLAGSVSALLCAIAIALKPSATPSERGEA